MGSLCGLPVFNFLDFEDGLRKVLHDLKARNAFCTLLILLRKVEIVRCDAQIQLHDALRILLVCTCNNVWHVKIGSGQIAVLEELSPTSEQGLEVANFYKFLTAGPRVNK